MSRRRRPAGLTFTQQDAIFTRYYELARQQGSSERGAEDWAAEVVAQFRTAAALDARCSPGLPRHETPIERGQREIAIRMTGLCRDDTDRLMFLQDSQSMAKARPEWTAERVAQELRDRGYGSRYGYAWTVRVATEALAQLVGTA